MTHTYDGYPPPTYHRESPARTRAHIASVWWVRNEGLNTDSFGVIWCDRRYGDRIYFDQIRGLHPAVGGIYRVIAAETRVWGMYTFTPIERVP